MLIDDMIDHPGGDGMNDVESQTTDTSHSDHGGDVVINETTIHTGSASIEPFESNIAIRSLFPPI